MAKKVKKELNEKKPAPVKSGKQIKWYSDRWQLLAVAGVLAATFIMYLPSLSSTKEFTNWDDPVYVVNQPLITQLDVAHVSALLKEPVSLNYHPVTMLSLALNYNFSQLHPFGYFVTNIILHLLNTFLVFMFLYLLSGGKFWVGAISALFFGIHPMHVESVAWISERKDLLYCFFFLSSCISYLSYLQTRQIKYILLCFMLFLFSCLSKAMAAPLPIVLLLIDYYRQRKFALAVVLEKLPFFAISISFGLLAVSIQSHGAIADSKVFTIPQRFMFASYGFVMYWVKFFYPTGLSTFYPYPTLNADGNFSWYYGLSVIAALAIVVVPGFLLFKRNKTSFRAFVFGMGFFIAMIAMVLQFISVGKAIMADRYTYVSYIGILFMLTYLLQSYFENAKTKAIALGLVFTGSAIFAVAGYSRVEIWENSGTLWTDVISKYPYVTVQNGDVITVTETGVDDAYKNRGNFYREHGDIDKAMADYAVLVRVKSVDEDAYSGLANFYAMKGDFAKALELYSESLKMKPGKLDTYRNRSITYSNMGRHKEALDDLIAGVKFNPGSESSVLGNMAFEKLSLGMWDSAVTDCNKLLAVNPNDADVLFYRGTAYINLLKYQEAINDLSISTKMKPSTGNAWFNLSFAYSKVGNKEAALNAAANAKQHGYKVSDDYLNGLKTGK